MWIKRLPACLAFLLAAWTARADDHLQWHGFLSQTAAHTDHNHFGGASAHDLAWDLREIGVNVSYRPNPEWLVSAQAMARWAGETDEGELRADYAFVERTLANGGDTRYSLALGKIKNAYGFYNSTRDVAHTRPGILMPQSVYLERIRNFTLASPGVSLRGDHDGDRADVRWQLGMVRMEADDTELEYLFVPVPASSSEASGHFEGGRSWLGQVMTDYQGGRWRLGVSLGEVAMRYAPAAVDIYPAAREYLRPRVLSVQHNREDWTLTAEYSYIGIDNQILGTRFTAEGWYVQAAWRPAPGWETWVRRDQLYFDKNNRDGSRFIGLGLETSLGHSHAWVAGVRHEFTPRFAVAAEIHWVEGAAMLSPQDNPGAPGSRFTPDWNLFLLQAAYRF